jgi:type IV pilus assembly protein PilQ
MRLKQLLALLTFMLMVSTVGMAANSQLTNISAAAQGNATVITLHASGAFTHTEYRPTDTLLLVDLSGVSAGKWKENTRIVELPGVSSYHVVGYTGSSGVEVARVEVTVAPGATVDVKQVSDVLNITISGKDTVATGAPVNAAAKPAELKPAVEKAEVEKVAPAKTATMHSGPVTVSDVSVARGDGSMNIEIAGNGPLTAKAMKLSSPARLVVDIANAVPGARVRKIPVNSEDIKDVRVAQFTSEPPVTRVVVDLGSMREYELVPSGNKVVVRVRASSSVAKAPVPMPAVKRASAIAPVVASKHTAVENEPTQKTASKPAIAAEAKITPAAKPVEKAATETKATESAPVEIAKATPAVESNPAKSQDFVMVEPQYHPAQPQSEPDPKAAAEAAANVIAAGMKDSERNPMPPTSASLTAGQDQQAPAPQAAAPAPAHPKYTGEPISVNLKDVDLKDFFRLIHEISGLNIVLDPNVRGTLTLVLDDVPWDQALDLVLANNGLDRKLEGNVLRIATVETLRKEADAQRAKNEAEALSVPKVTFTHFLSYARAADIVPTVKKFLSQRGDVIADARTNSLIIQDIPSVIPEIQRLLTQLDRKTQEVEIEARVVAATRSFARDIGTQLGFGWGNNPTAVGGATTVGTSPLQVAGIPNPRYFIVGTNQIPLFTNFAVPSATSGLSFSNASSSYRVDAILTAAEQRGLLKILSRPRIVTQNNVQANVKQGLRIPVVTQAQLGGPPTTTYVDAFLRLTVTPQITVEKTIFLNLDVENTTPDFGRAVQGNPTLITQQATTSVLVTDGGTVVIGGVIQTQNQVSVQQVPLLGDVPVLGNLFKRRTVSTSTQELLFFVTPKIVQT